MPNTADLTESMFSNWRVIAIDGAGKEYMIFTGRSITQVSENYADSFAGLTPDEQESIREIVVQRWDGIAAAGKWVNRKSLAIPTPKKTALAG